MNIIGLIRVRNEEHIIRDTLDHMAAFCTGGIIVFDDASTDATPELCQHHSAVRRLIQSANREKDIDKAPAQVREAMLQEAREVAGPEDWLVYMDADERIEFNFNNLRTLPPGVVGIRMKLFDFYITAEDAPGDYQCRRWLGPEYRQITMAFRNLPEVRFCGGRQIYFEGDWDALEQGYVRHYGKAISVDAWEQKCRYYAENYPNTGPRSRKWKARHGKAVHTVSDFGLPLIEWADREALGVRLTPELEQREPGAA